MADYNFDAPVPGQALTSSPGSSPLEYPPQFTDVNEALEYTWEKLTKPKQVTRMVLMLKKSVPIEYIVSTLLFQGVISGKWTVDLALMMYQVVFWQVEAIAKFKKVKYIKKNPDAKQDAFLETFVDILDTPPEQATSSGSIFSGLM